MRQNARRRLANRRRKASVRQSVRALEETLQSGRGKKKAAGQLSEVYRQLDKVAAKGTLHRNAAARKKSRLARRANRSS